MTDIAVQGLNGMAIGDKSLRVKKASIGITQVAGVEMGVNAMSMLAGTTSTDQEESRVLQLLNMVTPEELMDNDDYEGKSMSQPLFTAPKANPASVEICDDVRDECSKFGPILGLKVPRPSGGSRQSAGVGKIFVKFDTTESAKKALNALAGRKFADRTVVTTYFPEVRLVPKTRHRRSTRLTHLDRKTLRSRRGNEEKRSHVGVYAFPLVFVHLTPNMMGLLEEKGSYTGALSYTFRRLSCFSHVL